MAEEYGLANLLSGQPLPVDESGIGQLYGYQPSAVAPEAPATRALQLPSGAVVQVPNKFTDEQAYDLIHKQRPELFEAPKPKAKPIPHGHAARSSDESVHPSFAQAQRGSYPPIDPAEAALNADVAMTPEEEQQIPRAYKFAPKPEVSPAEAFNRPAGQADRQEALRAILTGMPQVPAGEPIDPARQGVGRALISGAPEILAAPLQTYGEHAEAMGLPGGPKALQYAKELSAKSKELWQPTSDIQVAQARQQGFVPGAKAQAQQMAEEGAHFIGTWAPAIAAGFAEGVPATVLGGAYTFSQIYKGLSDRLEALHAQPKGGILEKDINAALQTAVFSVIPAGMNKAGLDKIVGPTTAKIAEIFKTEGPEAAKAAAGSFLGNTFKSWAASTGTALPGLIATEEMTRYTTGEPSVSWEEVPGMLQSAIAMSGATAPFHGAAVTSRGRAVAEGLTKEKTREDARTEAEIRARQEEEAGRTWPEMRTEGQRRDQAQGTERTEVPAPAEPAPPTGEVNLLQPVDWHPVGDGYPNTVEGLKSFISHHKDKLQSEVARRNPEVAAPIEDALLEANKRLRALRGTAQKKAPPEPTGIPPSAETFPWPVGGEPVTPEAPAPIEAVTPEAPATVEPVTPEAPAPVAQPWPVEALGLKPNAALTKRLAKLDMNNPEHIGAISDELNKTRVQIEPEKLATLSNHFEAIKPKEVPSAQQIPETGAPDGSGGPQPIIREEGGDQAVGGKGVEPSGQGEQAPEVKTPEEIAIAKEEAAYKAQMEAQTAAEAEGASHAAWVWDQRHDPNYRSVEEAIDSGRTNLYDTVYENSKDDTWAHHAARAFDAEIERLTAKEKKAVEPTNPREAWEALKGEGDPEHKALPREAQVAWKEAFDDGAADKTFFDQLKTTVAPKAERQAGEAEVPASKEDYDADIFLYSKEPDEFKEGLYPQEGAREINHYLRQNNDGRAHDLIKHYLDTVAEPAYGDLAKALLRSKALRDTKVGARIPVLGARGIFIPNENYIGLSHRLKAKDIPTERGPLHLSPTGDAGWQTAFHELTHAATVKAVMADPRVEKELNILFARAKEHAKNTGREEYYGLKNNLEFLSEARTNSEFQDFLRGAPAAGADKNLWSSFVSWVRRTLRLEKSSLHLLDDVLKTSEKAIKRGSKLRTPVLTREESEKFASLYGESGLLQHTNESEAAKEPPEFTKLEEPEGALRKMWDAAVGTAKFIVDTEYRAGKYARARQELVAESAGLEKVLRNKEIYDPEMGIRADFIRNQADSVGHLSTVGINNGFPYLEPTTGMSRIIDSPRFSLRNIQQDASKLPLTTDYKGRKAKPIKIMGDILRIKMGEQELKEVADARSKLARMERMDEASRNKKENKEAMQEMRDFIKDYEAGRGKERVVRDEHIMWANQLLARTPKAQDIVDRWQGLNENLLDYAVATNWLPKDTAEKWKDRWYAPMYKSIEDIEAGRNMPAFPGGGPRAVGKIKGKQGSLQTVNIWENLARHYTYMLGNSMVNHAKATSYKQLERQGLAQRTSPDDKANNVVKMRMEGQPFSYKVFDEDAFRSLTMANMGSNWLINLATLPARWVRNTSLMQPGFWYRTVIRDPVAANLLTTGKPHPWGPFKAIPITPIHTIYEIGKMAFRINKEAKELRDYGTTGYYGAQANIENFALGLTKSSLMQKMGERVHKIHAAMDDATRVVVYKAAKAEAERDGITDPQVIKDIAALKAQEFTNFATRGHSQWIRQYGRITPFFHAQLAGLDRVIRQASGYGLPPKDAARAKSNFITGAAIMSGMTMAYTFAMLHDKRYRDLPIRDWANNFIIYDDPDENGDAHGHKLPIPQELGFMFKIVPELTMRYAMGLSDDAEAKKAFNTTFLDLMVPPGTVEGPTPPVLRGWQMMQTGVEPHSGLPIESQYEAGLLPEDREKRAGFFGKQIQKQLGALGEDLSPDRIDALLRTLFSTSYDYGAMAAEMMWDAHTGKRGLFELPFDKDFTERYPIAKDLYTNPRTISAVPKFYETAKPIYMTMNSMNKAAFEGDAERYKEITEDPDMRRRLEAHPAVTEIKQQINDIERALTTLEHDKRYNEQQKRKIYWDNIKKRNELARKGFELIAEVLKRDPRAERDIKAGEKWHLDSSGATTEQMELPE